MPNRQSIWFFGLFLSFESVSAWSLTDVNCIRRAGGWSPSFRASPLFGSNDLYDGDSIGPEKSQMNNFIRDFLQRKNNKPDDTSSVQREGSSAGPPVEHTHLVAIPMENCHELLLDLESVQRAILYHCPILAHACIPQEATRLPLLYVTVNNDGGAATERLFDIVNDVIQDTLLSSKPSDDDKAKQNPLFLSFESLEMDGAQNEVLQTVSKDEEVTRLRKMLGLLQTRIRKETGWKTELPHDPHSNLFRPRIPFMRLPRDWDNILSEEHGTSDQEQPMFLTSDQGGNGISPIFWFKWAEDKFSTARMREVAVYKRVDNQQGLDEQAFRLPYSSIFLPTGDDVLTKLEEKFRGYQERRMLEEAERVAQSVQEEDVEPATVAQDDILLEKTKRRLEVLYGASPSNTSTPETEQATAISEGLTENQDGISEWMMERIQEERNTSIPETAEQETATIEGLTETQDGISDWMMERIQQVVSSRERTTSYQKLAQPKEKPPIEENEVFAKYKDGTLVPEQSKEPPNPKLPPFPSREHCVGFWRVVSSPTGFNVEEGDAARSDNLILRVDGITAGGPILDQETRQKAAGGTWRLQGSTRDDAVLLIRLVIPPKKERILVMEGRLEQASLGGAGLTLAGTSFGIPSIEERKASNNADMQDLLSCSGNVWVEDAVTKANRVDIGSFSLMKIDVSSNPDSYTITVPRPVRNQD